MFHMFININIQYKYFLHRIPRYSGKVSTREENKKQGNCKTLCFTSKRKNKESFLLDTSIILNTYTSINNAFRSSHQGVLCKIAVLHLSKRLKNIVRAFMFLHALRAFIFYLPYVPSSFYVPYVPSRF